MLHLFIKCFNFLFSFFFLNIPAKKEPKIDFWQLLLENLSNLADEMIDPSNEKTYLADYD